MKETRSQMGLILLLAFVLEALPLPAWFGGFWPSWVALVVIRYSLLAPRLGGLGLGFLGGLLLDIYTGAVLGQHAIAYCLLAYVGIRQHLLVRPKSMAQQVGFVALLLLLAEVAIWVVDGWTGRSTGDWSRWLPILTSAALWPVLQRQR
jgi:rod shape-determining protein MreD